MVKYVYGTLKSIRFLEGIIKDEEKIVNLDRWLTIWR